MPISAAATHEFTGALAPVSRNDAGRLHGQALGLQNRMLWLLIAVSFFVFFEPSPYEGLFALTALVFA